MKSLALIGLLLPAVLWGCAAGVDVRTLLRDFDGYDEDLRAVATDPSAIETLDAGQAKRTRAGTLVEQGKEADAAPVAEQALADARLALEMDEMDASERHADECRLEVEQARAAWEEADFILEQTEGFVGTEVQLSTQAPEGDISTIVLPPSTLDAASFPSATMDDVAAQWYAWRKAAREHKVAVADLENTFRRSQARVQAENVDEVTLQHHRYLAARAAQALECRVRAEANAGLCVDATQRTVAFGEARAEALRATLDLERGLQDDLRNELSQFRREATTQQDDLRNELSQLRREATTRQDELYNALSQMEGKFARIRRDARGTIVSLADILFDFDKATLRRDVEFNLVKIATILNQFEEMTVLVEGHTDSIGTDEYNLGLSQQRAQAVYDFLVYQDVDPARLSVEGYGESRPVADNETEEGRQRNRRVDLVIQDAK
jgi:outer membrane protein OmpA-like peptidoglycan-associated protein